MSALNSRENEACDVFDPEVVPSREAVRISGQSESTLSGDACHPLDLDRLDRLLAEEGVGSRVRDEVFRELNPILRSIAQGRRGGRLLDPEDAVQEAWVVVLARIPRFRVKSEGGLQAWLAVVVRNRLANLERQVAGIPEVPLDSEEASTLVGREEDPAIALERSGIGEEVRAALEEARSRLPEISCEVVRLKWFEGRTTLEIGGILRLSDTQVRDRDRRALMVLRDLIKRRVPEELIGLFGEGIDLPGWENEEVTS